MVRPHNGPLTVRLTFRLDSLSRSTPPWKQIRLSVFNAAAEKKVAFY
jgi:hypothetical protein